MWLYKGDKGPEGLQYMVLHMVLNMVLIASRPSIQHLCIHSYVTVHMYCKVIIIIRTSKMIQQCSTMSKDNKLFMYCNTMY